MVASGTKNARAISAVSRPPTVRRVSATRASTGSAGWAQVKTRRSRSSHSGSAAARSAGSSDVPPPVSSSIVIHSLTLPTSTPRRRSTSSARRFATVVSHAPGVRGTPSVGQCRAARSNASAVASSATSQSPVARMRVATMRVHSSRYAAATASVAARACASARGRVRARLVASLPSVIRCRPRSCADRGSRRRPRPASRSSRAAGSSSTSNGHIGRSSMRPNRAIGCRLATSIASSRSRQSSTSKPAIHSFDSVNGPSVTRSSPPRTRTSVASSTGRSRSPITRSPRASTSATHSPMLSSSGTNGSASGSVATNIMYRIRSPSHRCLTRYACTTNRGRPFRHRADEFPQCRRQCGSTSETPSPIITTAITPSSTRHARGLASTPPSSLAP